MGGLVTLKKGPIIAQEAYTILVNNFSPKELTAVSYSN